MPIQLSCIEKSRSNEMLKQIREKKNEIKSLFDPIFFSYANLIFQQFPVLMI